MKEETHYSCETEFDDLARIGVDKVGFGFKYMTNDETIQSGEVFFV